MPNEWVGGILAFGLGVCLSAASYAFARFVLKKHPQRYLSAQVVRQLVTILFVVALFALGEYTPWGRKPLLVGGVLGVTLPMIWFTYRLVRLNEEWYGKGGPKNG